MTATAPASTASRDAATVTAWNVVSRLTGLARVVVFGGALGATRLGDTYHATNQISNVVFELLAAGTLSAVLVPSLVARLAQHDPAGARAFAGLVLGRLLLVLGPLVLLGLMFAEPLMRLVFGGNQSTSRDAQVRLGVFLLFFVLPQLFFYAWGALLSALLHADGRFMAAAIGPIANNIVVTAGLGWFWIRGAEGLALQLGDRLLLGGAALGGVVAMTLVPAFAAWRAGLGVVPRLGRRVDRTGIGIDVLWASLVVIPPQLVVFASIVVASGTNGGVAAYQIAFTFFLLPHALVGHPTATVLYPRMAAAWAAGDAAKMRRLSGGGVEVIGAAMFVAAAGAIALAPWLVRVVAVGALDDTAGTALTATALAWLAIGLPAYASVLFLSRVSYAGTDLKLPSQAALLGGVAAVPILVAAFRTHGEGGTVALVALAHSVMVIVSAALLLTGNVRAGLLRVPVRRLLRYAAAATAAGGAARLVVEALPRSEGRVPALLLVLSGATVTLLVYVASLAVTGQRSAPRLGDA